jgi:biopolymer transport protein ExbB/TolQ
VAVQHYYSEGNSSLGQLGQAFSHKASSECAVVTGVHDLGLLATILGLVGCILAVIIYVSRRR